MIAQLRQAAEGGPAEELLDGLFGAKRRLYKRLAEFSFLQRQELYAKLARRPYPWLVACAEQFASLVSTALGRVVAPHELLFDAPPMHLEVQFDVEIHFLKENRYRPLAEASPVVRTLATEQFDDYVKRVRIFAHPRVVQPLGNLSNLGELLTEAIERTDGTTPSGTA
jgi:hypothetical protein